MSTAIVARRCIGRAGGGALHGRRFPSTITRWKGARLAEVARACATGARFDVDAGLLSSAEPGARHCINRGCLAGFRTGLAISAGAFSIRAARALRLERDTGRFARRWVLEPSLA